MCSNPSTRKQLTIRPDFDMDVYLHPPTMHRRSRRISTSSIDSTDESSNNGSLIRRFSFSSIFAHFRQNSSPEFSTLNNINGIEDKNESPQIDGNKTATNFPVKSLHVEKL